MASSPLGVLIENERKEKEKRKLELKQKEARRRAREEFYKDIIEDDCKKYTVFNEKDEERLFIRKTVKEKPKAPSLQRQFGQTLNYDINKRQNKNMTPPALSRGLPASNNKTNSVAGGQTFGQKLAPSSSPNSCSLMQRTFKK